MTGSLTVDSIRVRQLSKELRSQLGHIPDIVAVSGALYANPKGAQEAHFTAALGTAASSHRAYVPHVFMVDDGSPDSVCDDLRKQGGIVLPIYHATEGGLAMPYVIAAQVIDEVCPDALMVKTEGEKDLFAVAHNAEKLLMASSLYDVITGVRSWSTLQSMPHYLRVTEAYLDMVIMHLTGVMDAASGVLALTRAGRKLFIERTVDPAWQYLIKTPYEARLVGMAGEVEVDFTYHPRIRRLENGNAASDDKRRKQLRLMLDCAVQTVGGEDALDEHQARMVLQASSALEGLERLAV